MLLHFIVKRVTDNENCLLQSLGLILYVSDHQHTMLREKVMEFMYDSWNQFCEFLKSGNLLHFLTIPDFPLKLQRELH
jgi:hypothetical protein